MKLEKVNLYHLRMPLVSPFETSFGRSTGQRGESWCHMFAPPREATLYWI